MAKRIIAFLISFCFIFEQAGFAQLAIPMGIPGYLCSLAPAADKFRPAHLRAMDFSLNGDNVRLVLDKGDEPPSNTGDLDRSAGELYRYFRVGMVLPDELFWVNLRPDSPDNVIDPLLAKTDVGRIMLEADLQLKKDLANSTSPGTPEGKLYWDRLYARAQELYTAGDIQIPTLTRPWIVPAEVIVRAARSGIFIYKATLKVMLEEDYLKDSADYRFSDPRQKELNGYSSQLIRELIIPKLTREVNSSKKYSGLRQVYYSLVLAKWFKRNFSGSALGSKIDSGDLTGLTSRSPWSQDKYFRAYRRSFENGEYKRQQQVDSLDGISVRRYTSGGIRLMDDLNIHRIPAGVTDLFSANQQFFADLSVDFQTGNRVDPAERPDGGAQQRGDGKTIFAAAEDVENNIAAALELINSVPKAEKYDGESLREKLKDPANRMLLNFSGGKLVSLFWYRDNGDQTLDWLRLATAASYRRQGRASALLRHLAESVPPGTVIRIPINEANESFNLYENLGFEVKDPSRRFREVEAGRLLRVQTAAQQDGGAIVQKDITELIPALETKYFDMYPVDAFRDIYGDDKVIDLLAGQLSGSGIYAPGNSIKALSKIGGPAVIERLIRELGSQNPVVRSNAAMALGDMRPAKAVEPLSEILLQDRNKEVRRAAAKALGAIGDQRAFEPLIAALKEGNDSVAAESAKSLGMLHLEPGEVGRIIKALANDNIRVRSELTAVLAGEKRAAFEPLLKALKDGNPVIRGAAAAALGKIGNSEATDSLIGALSDIKEDVRYSAAEALGRLGDRRAVKPLVEILRRKSGQESFSAARILGSLGDPAAVEPLIEALHYPSTSGRNNISVAGALARINTSEAVGALIAALSDPDRELRRTAAEALSAIPRAELIAPLEKALNDEYGAVREAAARALGEIGSPEAVQPLLAAWEGYKKKQEDVSFAGAIVGALGKIGGPRSGEVLISALADRYSQVYLEAIRALGAAKDPRAVEPLMEMWREAGQEKKGYSGHTLITVLSQIDGPEATGALISFLSDKNKYFRFTAAKALVDRGDRRAVGRLIKALESSDWAVREYVVRALGNIKDPRAVDPLIRILKNDLEPLSTREFAAEALGNIQDEKAISVLGEALQDRKYEVRAAAAEGLAAVLWKSNRLPEGIREILRRRLLFSETMLEEVSVIGEARRILEDWEKEGLSVLYSGDRLWFSIEISRMLKQGAPLPEIKDKIGFLSRSNREISRYRPAEGIEIELWEELIGDRYLKRETALAFSRILGVPLGKDGKIEFALPPSSSYEGQEKIVDLLREFKLIPAGTFPVHISLGFSDDYYSKPGNLQKPAKFIIYPLMFLFSPDSRFLDNNRYNAFNEVVRGHDKYVENAALRFEARPYSLITDGSGRFSGMPGGASFNGQTDGPQIFGELLEYQQALGGLMNAAACDNPDNTQKQLVRVWEDYQVRLDKLYREYNIEAYVSENAPGYPQREELLKIRQAPGFRNDLFTILEDTVRSIKAVEENAALAADKDGGIKFSYDLDNYPAKQGKYARENMTEYARLFAQEQFREVLAEHFRELLARRASGAPAKEMPVRAIRIEHKFQGGVKDIFKVTADTGDPGETAQLCLVTLKPSLADFKESYFNDESPAQNFAGELARKAEFRDTAVSAGVDPDLVPELYDRAVRAAGRTRFYFQEWIDGPELSVVMDNKALSAQEVKDISAAFFSVGKVLGKYVTDPHADNIMRRNNGKLAIIDLGMLSSLEDDMDSGWVQRYLFLETLNHVYNPQKDGLLSKAVFEGALQGLGTAQGIDFLKKALGQFNSLESGQSEFAGDLQDFLEAGGKTGIRQARNSPERNFAGGIEFKFDLSAYFAYDPYSQNNIVQYEAQQAALKEYILRQIKTYSKQLGTGDPAGVQAQKITVEYRQSGAFKDIFKVTVLLPTGKPVNMCLAVFKRKQSNDFPQAQSQAEKDLGLFEAEADIKNKFPREAQALGLPADLVPAMYDEGVSRSGALRYYLQEWIDGPTVADIIKNRVLTRGELERIAQAWMTIGRVSGEYVQDSHGENMMMRPDGSLVIVDLGVMHPIQPPVLDERQIILDLFKDYDQQTQYQLLKSIDGQFFLNGQKPLETPAVRQAILTGMKNGMGPEKWDEFIGNALASRLPPDARRAIESFLRGGGRVISPEDGGTASNDGGTESENSTSVAPAKLSAHVLIDNLWSGFAAANKELNINEEFSPSRLTPENIVDFKSYLLKRFYQQGTHEFNANSVKSLVRGSGVNLGFARRVLNALVRPSAEKKKILYMIYSYGGYKDQGYLTYAMIKKELQFGILPEKAVDLHTLDYLGLITIEQDRLNSEMRIIGVNYKLFEAMYGDVVSSKSPADFAVEKKTTIKGALTGLLRERAEKAGLTADNRKEIYEILYGDSRIDSRDVALRMGKTFAAPNIVRDAKKKIMELNRRGMEQLLKTGLMPDGGAEMNDHKWYERAVWNALRDFMAAKDPGYAEGRARVFSFVFTPEFSALPDKDKKELFQEKLDYFIDHLPLSLNRKALGRDLGVDYICYELCANAYDGIMSLNSLTPPQNYSGRELNLYFEAGEDKNGGKFLRIIAEDDGAGKQAAGTKDKAAYVSKRIYEQAPFIGWTGEWSVVSKQIISGINGLWSNGHPASHSEYLAGASSGKKSAVVVELPLESLVLTGIKYDKANKPDGGAADPGGIDFRGLPSVGQPALTPQLQGLAVNSRMTDLDKEWSGIRGEMLAPRMPYGKIKEYIAVCSSRPECRKRLDKAVSCIIDILRMEEDRALPSSAELKEILTYLS